jgi:thioredoxin-related protein
MKLRSIPISQEEEPTMKNALIMITLVSVTLIIVSSAWAAGEQVNMSAVKALAQRPVDEILTNPPVSGVDIEKYWKEVRSRNRPMIVFFYANNDAPSQRLATLVLYVAREYSSRIDFRSVKVSENGPPSKESAKRLETQFSLDSTPGILFYDNVKNGLVLEQEAYIDADYKEFRTPQMFLWKTYYAESKKALNNLLAD